MRMLYKIGLALGGGILLIYVGGVLNFIAIQSMDHTLGRFANIALVLGGMLMGFSMFMLLARAVAMKSRALIQQLTQKQEVDDDDLQ